MTTTKKLTRSENNRVIGGVCGGIAERYNWEPRKVRLAFLLSCLLPGPQFIAYLVLWFAIPSRRTVNV
ncbi:phage shock protein C (PspC) family protein [Herbihabitans rhizosphaerae]|uniref:Phage shock protein C (PspC) family protein n=1 Tax=Herbihabitans rhizosphaerae TaxID=1872711 RepID=A0A4Q7KGB3_9PSEU|nr:PspC domain-containing protein [Herbihabitans rhizosphaerae]RZS34282.1 phage shock protein C (PspC) family protein [Herbihabitans rhizosphaerae]